MLRRVTIEYKETIKIVYRYADRSDVDGVFYYLMKLQKKCYNHRNLILPRCICCFRDVYSAKGIQVASLPERYYNSSGLLGYKSNVNDANKMNWIKDAILLFDSS